MSFLEGDVHVLDPWHSSNATPASAANRLPSNGVAIGAEHVLCTGIVQTRNSKEPILPVVAAITVTSHASDAMVAIPFWLEMFAVVAASISGVLVAREHKLDLVGAVALAVVCGLGGGLLRDMTLQVGNVYILNQPMALPLSIATAAIIYIFPAIVDKPEKLIPLLDIISVGIYAATGADKALVYGFAPAVCIMMGFFTAVGGGMLRDGFMGVVPGIFQRTNFYAIAAIAGSTSYVCLVMSGIMSNVAALVVCVAVTMGLRWLSLRFDIKSPTEEDIARFLHRKK
jgi:uncharacterized membrane protein YeiH